MAENQLTGDRSADTDRRGRSSIERKEQRLVYAGIVVLTAVGIGASGALLVDYIRPLPLFCSESGGCAHLRGSIYSHVLGLPTPAVGLIGYFAMAALAIARGHASRFLHLVTSTFGALVAAYFLFLQFVLATFCGYCLTVDLATILMLVLVLFRVRTEADGPKGRGIFGVGALFAVVAVVPFLSNVLIRPRVPDVIAAEIQKTAPGEVTIVDFIDFECPYCRQTASDFQPTLEKYRGRYRLVRKQMPLARLHPHADAAARAACCSETFKKGDEMAAALISAPVNELTDEGCAKIASGLGIDEAAFRACLVDPQTQKKIQADEADFKAAHGQALPTIWIGRQMIEGAQGADKLREAMEQAVADVGG